MIIVRNLVKTFDNKITAADNLSFHISKGEKVGLIGVNGAGKTTLIRMICGLLKPDSGYIRVFRKNPLNRDKSTGMRLGMVHGLGSVLAGRGKGSFGFDAISAFANAGNLESDLNVKSNLELIKTIYEISDEAFEMRLNRLHEALGIREYMNYRVSQLSLGQKMRLEIASVLLYEPELLILDEPFIGIDVSAKGEIRQLLRELSGEKKATIILTTHNVDEIEKICSRVIFLDKGKMIYNGSFDRIGYSKGNIRTISVEIKNQIPDLQDLPIIKYELEEHHLTAVYDNNIINSKEIVEFLAARCRIDDLLIHKPTIEEIIQQLYAGRERK